MKKKIEVLHLKPSELNHNFGNPRKITKQKAEELKKSLEIFGDHDVIKITENNSIISGNQRVEAMLQLGIDTPILCKKLIGYSEKELKKINVDSNSHFGEWDFDLLNEWKIDIEEIELNVKDIDIIKNINENDEWLGMPDYENIEKFQLNIRFDNAEIREEFVNKFNIKIRDKLKKVWCTWYPYKDNNDLGSIEYV